MLRKLCFVLFLVLCIYDNSFAAVKKEKFNGAILTGCRLYQLGQDEFVLKVSGRKLPNPENRAFDDTLNITFYDAKASRPGAITSQVRETIESVPMIYDFSVENLSDDDTFSVSIEVKGSRPLTVASSYRSSDGFNIRIKSDKKDGLSLANARVPPPKITPAPETDLPFRVNQKITLELRDAELRDVLRGLMSYLGRNVIIDPSVPSDILVTMTLVDVRIDDVLNYIMRTYDLAAYSVGVNTTAFGAKESLFKLSGGKNLRTFPVSYAEPAQVSTLLKSIAGLDDNSLAVDERMRVLYVNTNPAKMEEVAEIISRLDVPQKQVMIQASIFEYNDADSLSVQNALQVAYDDIQVNLGGTSGIGVNYRQDRSVKGSRSIWTARTIVDTFSALQGKNKGRVLANPSVIAIDGLQATIKLTNDYMYQSGKDEAGNVTFEKEEIGPQLTFTPRIERDGYVRLKLQIQTGDVIGTTSSGNSENIPITSNRDVTTEIRVRSGMPFVIGGLFQDSKSTSLNKIPVLGNIPYLGDLFSYKLTSKNRTQAVMVVTPYILDSD